MTESLSIENLSLRLAKSNPDRIFYLILPEGLREDTGSWLQDMAVRHDCSIVLISGVDWNKDMTPWPAQGVFKKEKPFGGNAEGFLRLLEEKIVPAVEKELGAAVPKRCLSGVSLSGLFAVWASYKTETFDIFGSISGSLWYDGFAQWCENRKLASENSKVILLLGDREKNSKNSRMAVVEKCTELIHNSISGSEYILEENTTHFSPIVPRIEKLLDIIALNRETV